MKNYKVCFGFQIDGVYSYSDLSNNGNGFTLSDANDVANQLRERGCCDVRIEEMSVPPMNYAYAADKIETLYNRTLEHIDRIYDMISPAEESALSLSSWVRRMESCVSEFSESSAVVIEIYIEMTCGADDWSKLHSLKWDFYEKLAMYVKGYKKQMDYPCV